MMCNKKREQQISEDAATSPLICCFVDAVMAAHFAFLPEEEPGADVPILPGQPVDGAEGCQKHNSHKEQEQPASAQIAAGNEVVGSVHQRRNQQAQAAKFPAALQIAGQLQPLGNAVEGTHEHAEAAVTGHSGNGTHRRIAQTVHQHIADVLPQGKAQRDSNGVHNAVKLAVKFGIVPGFPGQQPVLKALLGKGDNAEIQQELVSNRAFRQKLIQYPNAQLLRRPGEGCGKNALQHQQENQSDRLSLQTVCPVDLHQQHDGRDYGCGDQNRIIGKKHEYPLFSPRILGCNIVILNNCEEPYYNAKNPVCQKNLHAAKMGQSFLRLLFFAGIR